MWSAVLTTDGLRFHLHVVTADYAAEDAAHPERASDDDDDDDDHDDDARSDWGSRSVWTNYQACSVSSTMWGDDEFVVAPPGAPLDLERLEGTTFRVDPIDGEVIPPELDLDDAKFGIYLLGHDSVVDHEITFVRRRGPWCYDVRWRARIALTYNGDMRLDHRLEADLPALRLARIEIEDELDTAGARGALEESVMHAETLRYEDRAFLLGAVPPG